MITFTLVLFVMVFWIIHFRYRRRRMRELASKIPPSYGELPVLGSGHHYIGNTEHIMSSLQKLSYECIKKGGITKGWLAHMLYITITNPADAEKVLKHCLDKDDLANRFIRKLIGYGVIFAPVSVWRVRRKILMPALAPKVVDGFMDIFALQSDKLAKKLEPFCDGELFSIWPFVNRYALDSVCETAIGVKINAQDDPQVPFLTALNRITNLVSERIFHLWFQPDWLYMLFRKRYTEHEKCRRIMQDFIYKVISKKREELGAKEKSEVEGTEGSTILDNYKDQSFLDLLIKSSGGEKGYNDIELREEILTLIIAGSDTSAIGIANTLVLLGKYPEIQQKVNHELSQVFEDSDRLIVREDLPKLQYLECVIKETLRLYPPVPILVRKVLRDTTLPSGYTLPAGAGVLVSAWGIHRDPKFWGPDAECFNPDRFLPERFNLPHPCCYLPFSNGPRNCVGSQYTFMSLKATLSTILRRYKVVGTPEDGPIPQMKMKMDLMMKDVNGYQVKLIKRKI